LHKILEFIFIYIEKKNYDAFSKGVKAKFSGALPK
jgi:hypothetical protein